MTDVVSLIVAFAGDHRTLAYLLAFVLAASESLPVLGALVPGTAAIVALAALVPDGALAVWRLITATTAGAIAGDGLAYGIGHRCKELRGRFGRCVAIRRWLTKGLRASLATVGKQS